MALNKSIPIKNIYYMLAYAFKELKADSVGNFDEEKFDNIYKLMTEIVIRGVTYQLKKGLLHDYVEEGGELTAIRGKLDITQSINCNSFIKGKVYCIYDEYTENTTMNCILKSVMCLLLSSDIMPEQKEALLNLLRYFCNISLIDLRNVKWNSFRFHRHNETYELLLNICRLICESMLETQSDGNVKLTAFSDDAMARLYEKFILITTRRIFHS